MLLAQPSKIRAERRVSEVLLPQPGREEVDLEGGMGIDPLQHIHAIDIRVDPLQPARGEETLYNPDGACAHFRPTEQLVGVSVFFLQNHTGYYISQK